MFKDASSPASKGVCVFSVGYSLRVGGVVDSDSSPMVGSWTGQIQMIIAFLDGVNNES